MNPAKEQYIEAHSKSQFVGFLLTFLFGPLGLVYSSWWAAVLLSLLAIPTSVVGLLLGVFVFWPLSWLISFFAVMSHNKRVAGMAALLGGHDIMNTSPASAPTQSKGTKTCPFCAEEIKEDAKVCRFCHKDVPEVHWATKYMQSMRDAEKARLAHLASLDSQQRKLMCEVCKGSDIACSKCAQTEFSVSIFISARQALETIDV